MSILQVVGPPHSLHVLYRRCILKPHPRLGDVQAVCGQREEIPHKADSSASRRKALDDSGRRGILGSGKDVPLSKRCNPTQKPRNSALTWQQRRKNRMLTRGCMHVEHMMMETKTNDLISDPVYDDIGIYYTLQLVYGIVNSHTNWYVRAAGKNLGE
ncbi:hypothetical protein CENSYa_1114 [Cenarchaeum symbiosum A]|uniref:Uncharacterized protein n=1 Tax=Cenarchaeum symbiosum (strain A) TaxID=414004 RepID=A0RWM6_CENSY|nr:hypothetical protein CENSYa_1114 [Cenarchaeum symbiosum A]